MIETIRNQIVKGLYEHTGCLVVNTDNNERKPEYPFISYKITSLNLPSGEAGAYTFNYSKSKTEGFNYDLIEDIELQPQMVISLTVYDKSLAEAQELALECWEWFKLVGRQNLKDINVTVVEVSQIQDRTTHLVDYYEYKQGFDVNLRWLHKFNRQVANIETYKIEGGIE